MANLWDRFEKGRVETETISRRPVFSRFVGEEAQKAGARFNAGDARDVQKMHDLCAGLCDKVHCAAGMDRGSEYGNEPGEVNADGSRPSMLGEFTNKLGARHSAADMLQFKAVHDGCCALGAKCR